MRNGIRLLYVVMLAVVSSISAMAQETTNPAGKSSAVMPEAAKATNSETRVKVKLRFYRWSFSNKITMPSLGGGDAQKAVKLTKEEREAIKRAESNADLAALWYKTGPIGGEQWNYIVMNPGKKTSAISYEGSPEISFCSKLPPRNAMEEAYYRPITKFVVPEGATALYVLMFVRGNNIKFFPMNLSPDLLNKDQVAIMNMTAQPIAVDMSGKKVILKSGGYKISNASRKGDEVEMTIFRLDDKNWSPVYRNKIIAKDDARTIILVYDPFGRKKLNPTIEILSL